MVIPVVQAHYQNILSSQKEYINLSKQLHFNCYSNIKNIVLSQCSLSHFYGYTDKTANLQISQSVIAQFKRKRCMQGGEVGNKCCCDSLLL